VLNPNAVIEALSIKDELIDTLRTENERLKGLLGGVISAVHGPKWAIQLWIHEKGTVAAVDACYPPTSTGWQKLDGIPTT